MNHPIHVANPPAVNNRAGAAYLPWVQTVRDAIAGLQVHLPADAAGVALFAAQVSESMAGTFHGTGKLVEVWLVLGSRHAGGSGARAEEPRIRGAGSIVVDEYLGRYRQGLGIIELKVDAIEAAAASLGKVAEDLLRVVLRHEIGHHIAPTTPGEAMQYDSENANAPTARAETAAQLFAFMTSPPHEQDVLRMLSEVQPPAYRMFEHFLQLTGGPGLSPITAWQLCESSEMLAAFADSWSGHARLLRELPDFVARRPPAMVWPALQQLAQIRIEELVRGELQPVGIEGPDKRSRLAFQVGLLAEIDLTSFDFVGSRQSWQGNGGISLTRYLQWPNVCTLLFRTLECDLADWDRAHSAIEGDCAEVKQRQRWLEARQGKVAGSIVREIPELKQLHVLHEALRDVLTAQNHVGLHVGPGDLPGTSDFPFGGFQFNLSIREAEDSIVPACFGVFHRGGFGIEMVVGLPAHAREADVRDVIRQMHWDFRVQGHPGSLHVVSELPASGLVPAPSDRLASWASANVNRAFDLLDALGPAGSSQAGD